MRAVSVWGCGSGFGAALSGAVDWYCWMEIVAAGRGRGLHNGPFNGGTPFARARCHALLASVQLSDEHVLDVLSVLDCPSQVNHTPGRRL